MSALPKSQGKSVDDLVELEAEGHGRYEIIDGDFVEVEVSLESSETNVNFAFELGLYIRQHRIGRVFDAELIYDLPKSTRHADVSVILNHRLPDKDASRYVGAPDLLVEVVSPTDRQHAVSLKAQEWLDAGARIVWVADPPVRQIAVYRRGKARLLTADEVLDGEDVLPGFSVPVASFFPEPLGAATTDAAATGGE